MFRHLTIVSQNVSSFCKFLFALNPTFSLVGRVCTTVCTSGHSLLSHTLCNHHSAIHPFTLSDRLGHSAHILQQAIKWVTWKKHAPTQSIKSLPHSSFFPWAISMTTGILCCLTTGHKDLTHIASKLVSSKHR